MRYWLNSFPPWGSREYLYLISIALFKYALWTLRNLSYTLLSGQATILYPVCLTHYGFVMIYGVTELGKHWYMYSLFSHYLGRCWLIVNWTIRDKTKITLKESITIYTMGNALKTAVCKNVGHFYSGRNMLQWRHNYRDGASNHQPHDYLLNRLFRRRSKKTWKFRVTNLCAGNSPAVNSPHKGKWRGICFYLMTSSYGYVLPGADRCGSWPNQEVLPHLWGDVDWTRHMRGIFIWRAIGLVVLRVSNTDS